MMTYPEPIDVGLYRDGEVEAIDLTYGGKAYSMTIVMPAGDGDVASLVESLDAARWAQIIGGLEVTGANVVMPKFTLEYELEMKDVLTALGMGIAFTDAADFSKMTPRQVYISEVKHKTFVDVNEEGTEAAAVTSVEMGEVSLPPTLTVDRPFLFAIRERFSGTILFIGRIMDPAARG